MSKKLELVKRCLNRLAVIQDTQDDGVYAKAYKQDVSELINWINELNQEIMDTTNEINKIIDRI